MTDGDYLLYSIGRSFHLTVGNEKGLVQGVIKSAEANSSHDLSGYKMTFEGFPCTSCFLRGNRHRA
jgi:hypothetical protein